MSLQLIKGRNKWKTPLTNAMYVIKRGYNELGVLQIVVKGDFAVGIFSNTYKCRRHQTVNTFQMYADHKYLGDMVERFVHSTEGIGVYLQTTDAPIEINGMIDRSHHLRVLKEREDLKVMVEALSKQCGGKGGVMADEALLAENELLKSKIRRISGVLTS